jgi:hypothetical protein
LHVLVELDSDEMLLEEVLADESYWRNVLADLHDRCTRHDVIIRMIFIYYGRGIWRLEKILEMIEATAKSLGMDNFVTETRDFDWLRDRWDGVVRNI